MQGLVKVGVTVRDRMAWWFRGTGRLAAVARAPVRAVLAALACLALDDRPLFLTQVTRLLFCQLSQTSRKLLGVPGTVRGDLAACRRSPPPPARGAPPATPNLAIGLAMARPGEDPGGNGARVLASIARRGHQPGWPGYDRACTQAPLFAFRSWRLEALTSATRASAPPRSRAARA
jgi:hypothetical protein